MSKHMGRLGLGGTALLAAALFFALQIKGPLVTVARAADTDSDGLEDAFEVSIGTDPGLSDTDGDGISDFAELYEHGTDPTNDDTDGDGTLDGADSEPLQDATLGGGSADGRTTPTNTWSSNLAAPANSGVSATEGHGVYVHSGEFVYSMPFLSIDPGYGPSISVSGTYRTGVDFDGIYGQNWVFSFGDRIDVLVSGDVDYYSGSTGLKYTFIQTQPSPPMWDPPVGWEHVSLEESSGDYVLTIHTGASAGSATTFHGSGAATGKPASTADRFGNTATFSYNGSGQLTTLTDATGHTISVTYYSSTGRVKDITDGDSRKVEFTYNYFGQLAKVRTPTSSEYPQGRVYEFRYINGSGVAALNGNMTRVIDAVGEPWLRNEFDTSDRVAKQWLGPDDLLFNYATANQTKVTDRMGNEREWDTTTNLPGWLKEYSNRNCRAGDPTYWQTSFGYSAEGWRNKVVYPNGNRVDTTFDAVGNVTEVRRKETDTASTSGTDVVDAYAYDGPYSLMVSHTDPEGNETTWTLSNPDENLVERVDHPTVTYLTPDQDAHETWTHNGFGQPLTHTDEDGVVTEYQYWGGGSVKKGYLKRVIVDSGIGGSYLNLTTEYTMNNWGTRTSEINPRAKTTTFTVNEYDWVTKTETTSPQGYEVKYTFDGNGRTVLKEVENVDATNTRDSGNPWFATEYECDAMGNLSEMEEEIDGSTTRTTSYFYTPNDKLTLVVKPEGNQFRYQYDERDLLWKSTRGYASAAASVETLTYDGNRNLTLRVDGRSKSWSHEYDLFDRRVKSLDPLGNYSVTVFDKCGHALESKQYDEDGATDILMAHSKRYFDERDRQWKVERGLKGVSSWTWLATTTTLDVRGLPEEVEDPRGKVTEFTFDAARRMTQKKDALNHETNYTHDANGNVTLEDSRCTQGCSTSRVGITEYAYDELDRRVEKHEVDEGNSSNKHSWAYQFDSLSVMVEQEDPEGNLTTWTHDALGRVLEESIDLGSSAFKKRTWGFDGNDRLVSHKDDGNNETTWGHNERDLVVLETYPDSGTKAFEHDLADNVTEWTDPNGTVVELVYDDCGRNTSRTITPASGVLGTTAEAYVYDAMGRMTIAQDDDVTVELGWDSLSRQTSETSGLNPMSSSGKTTSRTFDAAGNVTRLDYPDGSFYVTRTYDDVNRLTKIEDASSNDIVTMDFDSMTSRLNKYTYQNGTTVNFGYDGFGRVTDLDHKTSTPTTFAGYDIAYDKVGNILYEEWSHDSGKGHNYAYDRAYRLRTWKDTTVDPSAEHATPNSSANTKKVEYNLSDDSDRSSVVSTPYGGSPATVSYTSNSVHEYTVVGGVSRAYDTNGNLVDDGTNDYEYDYRNQLVRVTRQSDSTVIGEYEYDALGRRTRKTLEDDSEIRFYHDGHHEIEEFDENGALLRKYLFRDAIDSIVMMEAADVADVDSDSNTSELVRLFYHCDGRTNVVRLTAAAQTTVESYECDPYGNAVIKDQGGSTVSASPVGNAVVFQRRRVDAESGLMYFRARHYDSVSGRWLQRDPLGIGAGANAREFASSNPPSIVDPLGLLGGRWAFTDDENGVSRIGDPRYSKFYPDPSGPLWAMSITVPPSPTTDVETECSIISVKYKVTGKAGSQWAANAQLGVEDDKLGAFSRGRTMTKNGVQLVGKSVRFRMELRVQYEGEWPLCAWGQEIENGGEMWSVNGQGQRKLLARKSGHDMGSDTNYPLVAEVSSRRGRGKTVAIYDVPGSPFLPADAGVAYDIVFLGWAQGSDGTYKEDRFHLDKTIW